MYSKDEQSIIAQCTPIGSGAIALLRLSGDDAITVADCFAQLSVSATLQESATHTIHHGHVTDNKGLSFDQVLFFLMRAPRTFTGQDTVEITCHNNQFIIEAIIERAITCGARRAQPGEFTKRSFLHGKVDLTQAEAINEIINAPSQYCLRKSMAQLEGSLSSYLEQLEKAITDIFALCQASFEFLDEEQHDLNFDKVVRSRLQQIILKIEESLVGFDQQEHISSGVRIALLGTVNAGKSTLFNALLGTHRAIVTEIAGTTRDTVEARKRKEHAFWLLVDTAGLRQTDDQVEKEGIQRARAQGYKADVVLLVIDTTSPLNQEIRYIYKELYEQHKDKCLVVGNKIDACDSSYDELKKSFAYSLTGGDCLFVSGKNKYRLSELENVISAKIATLFSHLKSPYLLNQRQQSVLKHMHQKMQEIYKQTESIIEYELLAYHLRDVLENFVELTGRGIDEKMMDTIFSNFCIGK